MRPPETPADETKLQAAVAELNTVASSFVKNWSEQRDRMFYLELRVNQLEETLRLIATPKRPDGTYNNCREACERLAREALWPK